MKNDQHKRTCVLSLRTTPASRNLIERLTATLTLRRGRRKTMTEVIEEAVALLAKREKVE